MSGYIGPLPVPQGIQRKQSFTATASQTTFNTNGYTDGNFINVYLNGVRLINGTDYTATNGSDIVLTTGASASDVLDFETFDTFELVDQQFENVTLKNPTHEDTDGGRESAVSFKGEQSGGEISTLAQIQASHDGTSDDQKGDLIFKTNDGSDNDAPTEAARIDSSQNFIVGKTATTLNTEGHVLAPTFARFTRDSAAPVQFNRTTNDGDITVFYKDGTEVGSIGVTGSRISVGGGDVGLFFDSTNERLTPWNQGTSADRDNAIDLGKSTSRFKDLYLGGGAYIGGTVAANKLDDFEEGTFTPRLRGATEPATLVTGEGRYTKIGDFVQVYFSFENKNTTGYSGGITFDQMPFTNGSVRTIGTVATFNAATWTDNVVLEVIGSSTTVGMQNIRSGNSWNTANHSAGSVRYLWGAYAFRQN